MPESELRMKKSLENLLTWLSNYRRIFIINQYKKEARILDLGCGTGDFIRQVRAENWQKYGVDPYLSFKNNNSQVKYYKKNLFNCRFPNKFFDVITLWHVIEHVSSPKKLLKEINRVLKDNGLLIISTPNLGGLGFKIAGQDWFHFNVPHHRVLFSLKSLKKILTSAGFLISKVNYPVLEYPLDLFHSIVRSKLKNNFLKLIFALPILALSLTFRPFSSLLKIGETIEVICVKIK